MRLKIRLVEDQAWSVRCQALRYDSSGQRACEWPGEERGCFGSCAMFWPMATQVYSNTVCIHLLTSNDQLHIPRVCPPQPSYMSLPIKCPLDSLSIHPNSFPDTFRQAPNLSHSRRRVRLIILFCPLTPYATQSSGNRWADMGEGCGQMGKRENGKW